MKLRPFEADATGISVPQVTTDDEVRQIVEWGRFHPVGKRALDNGNTDGQYCLVPLQEYLHSSNEERGAILQMLRAETCVTESIAANFEPRWDKGY